MDSNEHSIILSVLQALERGLYSCRHAKDEKELAGNALAVMSVIHTDIIPLLTSLFIVQTSLSSLPLMSNINEQTVVDIKELLREVSLEKGKDYI